MAMGSNALRKVAWRGDFITARSEGASLKRIGFWGAAHPGRQVCRRTALGCLISRPGPSVTEREGIGATVLDAVAGGTLGLLYPPHGEPGEPVGVLHPSAEGRELPKVKTPWTTEVAAASRRLRT